MPSVASEVPGFRLQVDDSVRIEIRWALIKNLPDLYIDHQTLLEPVHDLRQVRRLLQRAIQ